jgi:Pentapeptide repeats (8 copies)
MSDSPLYGANLSGADLSWTNLTETRLGNANLQNAQLKMANLTGTILNEANLRGADLTLAKMKHTNLISADLSGADLTDADMSGAEMKNANLSGATFEPRIPPSVENIVFAHNLSRMVYKDSPTALVTLREGFKKAGLRRQEREVTYAIKRSEAAIATTPAVERSFNYVMFDLTSQYGMSPGRPLRILLSLMFLFVVPYMIALRQRSGGGIWMLWSKERLLSSEGQEAPIRLTRSGMNLLWTAFYFSLLSAFNIGWREINVGNWLSRLQLHEYSLRATGWVRTVSGIQSLTSVYLVAIWVLTYFGRPFE